MDISVGVIVLSIVAWVGSGVVVVYSAGKRGLSGAVFFFYSMVFSPLVGALLMIAELQPYSFSDDDVKSGRSKIWEACRSAVSQKATQCWHCGPGLALLILALLCPHSLDAQSLPGDPTANRAAFVSAMNTQLQKINKNGAVASADGTTFVITSPVADDAHFAALKPSIVPGLPMFGFTRFVYTNGTNKTFTYDVPSTGAAKATAPSGGSWLRTVVKDKLTDATSVAYELNAVSPVSDGIISRMSTINVFCSGNGKLLRAGFFPGTVIAATPVGDDYSQAMVYTRIDGGKIKAEFWERTADMKGLSAKRAIASIVSHAKQKALIQFNSASGATFTDEFEISGLNMAQVSSDCGKLP